MERGGTVSGIVVAIDGPSGSGKSTIARRIARHYALAYLDTGAMYRALAWWALQEQVELTDADAVVRCAENMDLVMDTDPVTPRVLVGQVPVTDYLHTAEISRVVSQVAVNLKVRALMKQWQRAIIEQEAQRRGIVAEGRDITTVVAPDADVRILLIASEEARLARRALQRHGQADATAIAATRDEVVRRDADDSTVSEFRQAADGVVTIDSSHLTLEETFAQAQAVVDSVRR